ncbi:unnamed protein product [Brachionus calyciflorus]|uniref:Uncharacterized protein n=1 Tax=Brachionus calyciflorus TaxID=104777 RepID=A0A814H7K4_9BILA|nr:unnamed protein product [Brachionus calyciflorus]
MGSGRSQPRNPNMSPCASGNCGVSPCSQGACGSSPCSQGACGSSPCGGGGGCGGYNNFGHCQSFPSYSGYYSGTLIGYGYGYGF